MNHFILDLETIRKQEQQTKLLNQLIEKFQEIIKNKDINYSNLERIKKECTWIEEKELWYLPEIIYYRTKLPPTELKNTNHEFDLIEDLFDLDDRQEQSSPGYNSPNKIYTNGTNLNGKTIKDRLFQKLEKNVKSNLAANYFKPKRQEQLLSTVQTYLTNSDENNNRIVNNQSNRSESLGLIRKMNNELGENLNKNKAR